MLQSGVSRGPLRTIGASLSIYRVWSIWLGAHVESYTSIQHLLPAISPFKQELIEVIVRIQLNWQTEYAQRYPKLAAHSRPILTSHDDLTETSFESYLRGELYTYSDRTLTLYAKHLAKIRERGENITLLSMGFLAKMSGFDDTGMMERASRT